MSYIIALTGGICSGKTTVTRLFSKLPGVSIIDADIIARNVTQSHSPTLSAIVNYFGPNILLSNGNLNRTMLKKRIFFNITDKKWLETLLHPIIRKETTKEIKKINYTNKYIIWVVPLLFENHLHQKADRILVTDIQPDMQLRRLINRDKIDKQYAKKILSSQTTRQHRLQYAHDIIHNNITNDITSKIKILHQHYINLKYHH